MSNLSPYMICHLPPKGLLAMQGVFNVGAKVGFAAQGLGRQSAILGEGVTRDVTAHSRSGLVPRTLLQPKRSECRQTTSLRLQLSEDL